MLKNYNIQYWPIAILVIASLIRVLFIGDIPGGLNQDEASSGYDAWALLTAGIDRNGVSWPVHFIAWGSGQNALYAYLSMPFIAIMGLTVTSIRLAAAILGVMALWLFWRLGKKSDKEMGLWALIVIATSPWHIMASRWALESNALPAVVLLATYFFSKAEEKPAWIILGSATLASSVYAYGTAYFFAPLFMVAAWFIIHCEKKISLKTLSISALTAFFIALPIMIFIINNSIGQGHIEIGPFTIPKYPSEARYSGIFLPLAPNGLSRIPDNIIHVLQMLLNSKDDGLPWNAAPSWGAQFLVLTPFLLLGCAYAINKTSKTDRLMLAWLVCALLTAFSTDANINRINLIWLPSLWLSARGLWLLTPKPLLNRLAQVGIVALGAIFSIYYFVTWQKSITNNFYYGLGDAITYIDNKATSQDAIIITEKSVYTSTLFFVKPEPYEFVKTARIPNPTSPFYSVLGFTHYSFGINNIQNAQHNFWVAHISELAKFNLLDFNIKTFGSYAAVTRKSESERTYMRTLELNNLSGQQDFGSLGINREVSSDTIGLPISEQVFPQGLGVHGDSEWSMDLPSKINTLEFGVGLSSSSGCSDGIFFSILIDNKIIFNSDAIRHGQLEFHKLDLENAKRITFTTKAGANNRCDHGLWITPVINQSP